MKSGGSSSGPTANPQPQGNQTTPYGNATPANPAWTSYLPSDPMASAQLGDPAMQRYSSGGEAPSTATLLPAQDVSAPMTTSNPTALKAMLAKLLSGQAAETRDALDGGYFSGTNARRQQLLRANRSYPGDQR
jgi:hypothetical protein